MTLLLLLACQGPDPIQLGPADTAGDPVAPGDPARCGAYSGYDGFGTRWAYASAEDTVTGTRVVEVTEVVGDIFRTTERTELVAADGSFSTVEERARSWGCADEGLLVYEDERVQTLSAGAAKPEVHTRRLVYDPPALWTPAALKPGDAWTVALTGVLVVDGAGEAFAWEARYEALGTARLEVPAGGFDTVEVLGTWDAGAGPVRDHRFLALDVGPVLVDETFALANYDGGR